MGDDADYLDSVVAGALAHGDMARGPLPEPLRCPYCGGLATFCEKSDNVYAQDWGPIWHCAKCAAWVGCHKRTSRPLGRLANAELREYKKLAHLYFDAEWGHQNARSRGQAYRALAVVLGMRQNDCHIGLMDVADCERVILACQYGLVTDVLRGLV